MQTATILDMFSAQRFVEVQGSSWAQASVQGVVLDFGVSGLGMLRITLTKLRDMLHLFGIWFS